MHVFGTNWLQLQNLWTDMSVSVNEERTVHGEQKTKRMINIH